MKKITLLFAAAAMALSCSDDDNNSVPLDGTWKLTNVKMGSHFQVSDMNGDGVISQNYMDETPCFDTSDIVFGNNNTAVFSANCMSNEYLPQTLSYTTSGNNVTFVYNSTELPGAHKDITFRRSGNTLTATFDYDDFSYIPGDGEYGDTNSALWDATFTYTKQ